MYLPDKPRCGGEGVDFYSSLVPPPRPPPPPQQMMMADSSSDDHEVKAPKKRAETWVQEETRSLIALRKEMDGLFNTSKSNKHLWEQISAKIRDKGFDRSPTMCTDKWRNLLKEFKKAKGTGSAKMSHYKELDELLKARNKNLGFKSYGEPNVDVYQQFPDKGGRSTLSMERHLEHDRHALAITTAHMVANGLPPCNWRDAFSNDNSAPFGGRIILVKWGEYCRKIGIDGTAEAIKEAIKSAFGLRTKRAFWLEDEDDVICSLDRDMPLGTYTLHLDEGMTIKVCIYDDSGGIPVHTEEKTLYTEDDFRDFLSHRGWIGLRELSGFCNVDTLDDLRPGAMYQGVRLLGDQQIQMHGWLKQ